MKFGVRAHSLLVGISKIVFGIIAVLAIFAVLGVILNAINKRLGNTKK